MSGATQKPGWDANGSLVSDGTNAYGWDTRNRLSTIGASGSIGKFVYDAFGRRTSATRAGTATAFLYAGDEVAQEQQSGKASANYLLGLGTDEKLSRTTSAGTVTYLSDLLGSTVGLVSGTSVQTAYGYAPYGATTTTGTSSSNTFQFTGRENDGTAAGLYYYRARYYNPAWGRFVSEDPIRLESGDADFYRYVGADPTDWVDPSGLQATFGKNLSSQRQAKICLLEETCTDHYVRCIDRIGNGRFGNGYSCGSCLRYCTGPNGPQWPFGLCPY